MHTINSIGLLLELAVLTTVIWSLQSKVIFECKTANNWQPDSVSPWNKMMLNIQEQLTFNWVNHINKIINKSASYRPWTPRHVGICYWFWVLRSNHQHRIYIFSVKSRQKPMKNAFNRCKWTLICEPFRWIEWTCFTAKCFAAIWTRI